MIESDIDRALFIKLLHKTCGFKILKDLVNGPIIIMDTWEAYHFARCFNFSQTYTFNYSKLEEDYLIYNFPHTSTKLNLDYQTHLDFQDIAFFTTPTKYIIPFEIKKSVNESYWDKKYNTNAINKILESNLKPQDCLITEIYLKTKGNSLENFLEYIASKIFIDKGYMVENQIFFRNLNFEIDIKIPDFGAYKFLEIQNMLINYGFIERGGFLYDLSFLRLRGRKKGKQLDDEDDDFIVGEAKTASAGHKTYIDQVKNYYKGGFFHKFLQITPKNPRILYWFDYLDFNKNGKVFHIIPKEQKVIHGKRQINLLKKAIIQKIKFYLLQNLYFFELLDLIEEKPRTLFHLNTLIYNIKLDKVLDFLDDII